MSRRSLLCLTIVAMIAVELSGCDALVDRPAIALDFGSPYTILFGEVVGTVNGIARPTPFTDATGALHVAVEYSGGCGNHVFRADHSLAESSATTWLVHATNGESCDAVITEEIVVPLHPDVLEKEEIILVGPGGQDEVIARFDAPSESP